MLAMRNNRGSSGRSCAVLKCHNNSRKLKKWKLTECEIHSPLTHEACSCDKPYSLHRFPGRKECEGIRRQWVKNINRKDFEVKKHSVVCGIHFPDGKPTEAHPYPVLNMGYTPHKELSTGRAPPKRRFLQPESEASTSAEVHVDVEASQEVEDEEEEVRPPEDDIIVELPSTAKTRDAAVQWPVTGDHNYGSTCTIKPISTAMQTEPLPAMSAHDLKDSDAKFFTGLSKDVFWGYVQALLAFLKVPISFKLAIPDQILLVLMRLRLGLMLTDLGKRFDVSRTTAFRIFAAWIPVMAEFMRENVILWLPRDTLRRIRPSSFAENYPNATCIIDCTEIFVQRPGHLKKRAQTYSNYKSHNTYKALYCIAPNGLVMFVSKLFGGRASDVCISQNSGFTDHLIPGDEVLADRGFTIDGILPPGVKLSIPAFTKGPKQLPESAVTDTRRLANVRIHVERAIRRLKCFKLLCSIIPGNLRNVDDIVTVCAGLCNMQPQLINEDIPEEEPVEIDNDDNDDDADGALDEEEVGYMLDFAEGME